MYIILDIILFSCYDKATKRNGGIPMLESWIFPVVICAALVVIIGLLFRKAKRGNGEFDERQELLRISDRLIRLSVCLLLQEPF